MKFDVLIVMTLFYVTRKMESVEYSENVLNIYQATRLHIPEDSNFTWLMR
jgi:hypothetical protein